LERGHLCPPRVRGFARNGANCLGLIQVDFSVEFAVLALRERGGQDVRAPILGKEKASKLDNFEAFLL